MEKHKEVAIAKKNRALLLAHFTRLNRNDIFTQTKFAKLHEVTPQRMSLQLKKARAEA